MLISEKESGICATFFEKWKRKEKSGSDIFCPFRKNNSKSRRGFEPSAPKILVPCERLRRRGGFVGFPARRAFLRETYYVHPIIPELHLGWFLQKARETRLKGGDQGAPEGRELKKWVVLEKTKWSMKTKMDFTNGVLLVQEFQECRIEKTAEGYPKNGIFGNSSASWGYPNALTTRGHLRVISRFENPSQMAPHCANVGVPPPGECRIEETAEWYPPKKNGIQESLWQSRLPRIIRNHPI